jgi:hypothetical protein
VVVPPAAVLPPFVANPAPNPPSGNNPAPNPPGGNNGGGGNNPPGGNNGGGGNNPLGGNNGGGGNKGGDGNNPPGGNNGAVDGNRPSGAGRNQARRPTGADALPPPVLLQPAPGFEPPFNVMVIYVDPDTAAMPKPPEGAFLYPYPWAQNSTCTEISRCSVDTPTFASLVTALLINRGQPRRDIRGIYGVYTVPDRRYGYPEAHTVSWIQSDNATRRWRQSSVQHQEWMLFPVYNSANMNGPPPAGFNWLDCAPFMPLREYQEVLEEEEADIAADAADGANIRRPRIYPRLEETFVARIQMYARRVVNQDRLRQVMVNRCLERYPNIDRGRFEINEEDVDFLLGDPFLDRPDPDPHVNDDQVDQEPVHRHGLMVQLWQ